MATGEDDIERATRGCDITDPGEREKARRRDVVKCIEEALTDSAIALEKLCCSVDARPNDDTEDLVVAISAIHLVVQHVLRNEVLTRDYGTQGMLKYPGLREWFKAKDAERAVAEQTQKLNPND
jgi:hypothetical protein